MHRGVVCVIGPSGAWWWQDHKAQQEEITTMADQLSWRRSSSVEGRVFR
ncbi:hypothetical protein ACLB1Q_31040 [Escherichia coli]